MISLEISRTENCRTHNQKSSIIGIDISLGSGSCSVATRLRLVKQIAKIVFVQKCPKFRTPRILEELFRTSPQVPYKHREHILYPNFQRGRNAPHPISLSIYIYIRDGSFYGNGISAESEFPRQSCSPTKLLAIAVTEGSRESSPAE